MLFFFLMIFCFSFGMGVNLKKMVVNFSLYYLGLRKSEQNSLNLLSTSMPPAISFSSHTLLHHRLPLTLPLLPHSLTSSPPSHSLSPTSLHPSPRHLSTSLSCPSPRCLLASLSLTISPLPLRGWGLPLLPAEHQNFSLSSSPLLADAKQQDPYVDEIIITATYINFYDVNIKLKQWVL